MKNLKKIAARLRLDALKMIYAAGSGHPGSSFSTIEVLTALYFGGFLNIDPKNPKSPDRDFFILSKGHAAPAFYAALGERGFFSKDEFFHLRQINSLLQGHPETFIPGVEIASGPLGQGLSVANGVALALKIDGRKNRVFSLHGDGELQEGNIWEAAMTAAKYKLDNLVAIIDRNHLQIDGPTAEVMPVAPVADKFRAFGWEVLEMDGHDFADIFKTLEKAIAISGAPVAIVANTIKGKGVSFMENQVSWHGKAPNDAEFEKAKAEIEAQINS